MKKKIWQSILDLKNWIQNHPENIEQIFLVEEKGNWVWSLTIDENTSPLLIIRLADKPISTTSQTACLVRSSLFLFNIRSQGNWDSDEIALFSDYLGYVFLQWEAQKKKRAITISHFAQTLDGQIATISGESKWIGNPENLIHAHRMRALCEGILIGSGTLYCDKPALTVRHVAGKNPQRIVLGNTQKGDFESLKKSCPGDIWSIGTKDPEQEDGITFFTLSADEGTSPVSCKQLLEWLWEKGIHSVYVEGGAKTTSCFLTEGMIDIMQLHLSPQVFGSGISAIQLSPIQSVSEAIRFDSFAFKQVGDSVMFVGTPKRNPS